MTTSQCDILIKAGHLMTQNESREIIEDAGLAITGGQVAALGPWSETVGAWAAPETIDLSGCLVLPGLINSHTHVSMTLLRGLADDLPLMDWLNKHNFPVEQKLTPELVGLGAMVGCAEMLASGTTAFCDMYLMESAVMDAVDKAGLRCVAGEVVFAFPSPAYKDLDAALDLIREHASRWKDHSRVRAAVMPHAVYTTTPELLTRCRDLAEELDLTLHIHLAETGQETSQCIEATGLRPVPYLDSLGLLGPRTLAAHVVDVTDDEISRLAETGTKIVHNPKSNMKLASGFCPAQKMLDAGAAMGLGTDGAASNNSLNMFREMNACALLQKVHLSDPTAMPAQTVLDMATLGGGACLNQPELGTLAPGGPADLTALDLDSPGLLPLYNPVSHAVYAASGGEVRLTMAEGRVLYRDEKFPQFDYQALLDEAAKAAAWVKKQI